MKKLLKWILFLFFWAYITAFLCITFYDKGYMKGEETATRIFVQVK